MSDENPWDSEPASTPSLTVSQMESLVATISAPEPPPKLVPLNPWGSPAKKPIQTQNSDDTAFNEPSPYQVPPQVPPKIGDEQVQIEICGQMGFVFKHTTYTVTRGETSVTRRYSDFVWLYDCLVKRYPFRALTLLPPKKLGPTDEFIQERRKGLKRFLTQVINHPVLGNDELVKVFTTFPQEIQMYRQTTFIYIEQEVVHDALIPNNIDDRIQGFKTNLPIQLEELNSFITYANDLIQVHHANASSFSKYSCLLKKSVENGDCILLDCSSCPHLNNLYLQMSNMFDKVGESYQDQYRVLQNRFLEGLKAHKDLIQAMITIFTRAEKITSSIQLDTMQTKIKSIQSKLETSPTETDKWTKALAQEQRDFDYETTRLSSLHATLWQEMMYYHYKKTRDLAALYQDFFRLDELFQEQLLQLKSSFKPNIIN